MAAAVLAGASAAHAGDITGSWDSNQGPLTITRAADSTYEVAFRLVEGKVTGQLDGDVMRGEWTRTKGEDRCYADRKGSAYWGGFKITFYTPGVFQGHWSYCGDEVLVSTFTGGRVK